MSTSTLGTGVLADPRADGELVALTREGDLDAFGALYGRHAAAAERLARQLARGPDADDLVADAFGRVLDALRRGGGPDEAFRAYLLTALRRLHVDRLRAGARVQSTDDVEPLTAAEPFTDTAVAGFEAGAAARAFASLPERWQLVLWHTEVEGQRPADVAPLLGISANSVAALAYRAREGLRRAFLTMHAQEARDDACGRVVELLGGFVRGGLSRRDAATVRAHLDGCRACTGIYLELAEVNAGIGALLAPALLGAAGAGYVGAALGGGVAAAGGGLTTPGDVPVLLSQATTALLARSREVLGHAGSAATSAGAGVAVGIAVTVAVVGGGVLAIQQDDPGSTPGATPGPGAEAPPAPGPGPGPGGGNRGRGNGGSGGSGGTGAPAGDPATQAETTGDEDGAGLGTGTQDGTGASPGSSAASSADSPVKPDGGAEPGAGKTADPDPPPAPGRDLSVGVEARRDAADFRVRVTVTGLGAGGSAEVAFGADHPAVVLRLDRRCDLVAVGRARCRVSEGSAELVFRARPLPDRRTTLRFDVRPTGGTRDAHRGNESAAVTLQGRLAG